MEKEEIEALEREQVAENVRHVYPAILEDLVDEIVGDIISGSLSTSAGRGIYRMLRDCMGYHTEEVRCSFCKGRAIFKNCGSFWVASCDSCDWQMHSDES